jgi:hypothetical protein
MLTELTLIIGFVMELKNEKRGRISEYVENIQTLNILMEHVLGK